MDEFTLAEVNMTYITFRNLDTLPN